MKVKREISPNAMPPRLRVTLMSVLLPGGAAGFFVFFFAPASDLAFSSFPFSFSSGDL